jgi:hypothetical protein
MQVQYLLQAVVTFLLGFGVALGEDSKITMHSVQVFEVKEHCEPLDQREPVCKPPMCLEDFSQEIEPSVCVSFEIIRKEEIGSTKEARLEVKVRLSLHVPECRIPEKSTENNHCEIGVTMLGAKGWEPIDFTLSYKEYRELVQHFTAFRKWSAPRAEIEERRPELRPK